MNSRRDFSQIRLLGGDLSLDFVNTVHDRVEEPDNDYLSDYSDLIEWSLIAGGIKEDEKHKLEQLCRADPHRAETIFKEALRLREAIYGLYINMLQGTDVQDSDLGLVNQWLSESMSKLELGQTNGHFKLSWRETDFGLESVLWPIMRSMAALITSDRVERLKECPACGWLFIDNSKNKSRRWCSMDTCGNRAKARRFYEQARN